MRFINQRKPSGRPDGSFPICQLSEVRDEKGVYRDQSEAVGDFEAISIGVPPSKTLHQGWVSFGTSLILFSVASSTAFLV